MWRSNAHDVVLKKGCAFTSEAPAREPRRLVSSFMSSFRMSDLHKLGGGQ